MNQIILLVSKMLASKTSVWVILDTKTEYSYIFINGTDESNEKDSRYTGNQTDAGINIRMNGLYCIFIFINKHGFYNQQIIIERNDSV